MLNRWLQDHPSILETAYRFTERTLRALDPLFRRIRRERLYPLFEFGERITKGWLFDCRMCGMCTLHHSGMTCPMSCPKQMRNGPCGGVRPDGKCEVIPEMDCVWMLAWERSEKMHVFGEEIELIQLPVDHQLQGTSAWLNMIDGRDQVAPQGWIASE